MDLLELQTLKQRGIGAETILKILSPMMEAKQRSLLARLSHAGPKLEDFLVLQAEAKLLVSVVASLQSMVEEPKHV